jgi:large subunit ribosomal protein L2
MNPVDHPHGGRTNKGGHPVTPQGFLTKGVKTRKKNSWSKKKLYAPKTKLI